jgi:crotonobetainyl-CoA:carnitine CoA-transferase CaiB-like acyl-CoA transferase
MLDDLTILELGSGVGPAYCGKLFADLGADVIKIEPLEGDVLRHRGPFPNDKPGIERSGLFAYLNTSKRGIALDVTKPGGRQVLLDLVRTADVLVENNAPAWLAAHEIDYERLRAINPRLVMTSITPFGQDGPWRDAPSNQFIAQHTSGVAYNNGQKARDLEAEPPIALPDDLAEYLGGLAAASATMCAIWGRESTGEGAHVDVALQEALAMHLHLDLAWITFAGTPTSRAQGAQPAIQWIGQQPVADGYIDFVIRTDEQWRSFVEVLGNPEWAANPLFATTPSRAQYWDGLEPLVREEFIHWRKEELFRAAQAKGVPASPVNSVEDAATAGHFQDRQAFVEYDHRALGRTNCSNFPIRFGTAGARIRSTAPELGEHNDEIMNLAGYTKQQVSALRDEGVIL